MMNEEETNDAPNEVESQTVPGQQTHRHKRPVSLFSTPLEIGLRALVVLRAIYPGQADLQRLVFFDYLLVHSADADGPESLHPATPHRSGEILVKRDLMREGLLLMLSRDLVELNMGEGGVSYRATDLAHHFLSYFDNRYVNLLVERATWLSSRFGQVVDDELRSYVAAHLNAWGGEFLSEAAVRDVAV